VLEEEIAERSAVIQRLQHLAVLLESYNELHAGNRFSSTATSIFTVFGVL
jgi:hypothetical protein